MISDMEDSALPWEGLNLGPWFVSPWSQQTNPSWVKGASEGIHQRDSGVEGSLVTASLFRTLVCIQGIRWTPQGNHQKLTGCRLGSYETSECWLQCSNGHFPQEVCDLRNSCLCFFPAAVRIPDKNFEGGRGLFGSQFHIIVCHDGEAIVAKGVRSHHFHMRNRAVCV